MGWVRFGRELVLVLVPLLGSRAGAQSVQLTRPLARGNLHHGTAALTRDGRWAVFAGRYSTGGPGINSLYGVASDGSSEPFLLYDHGDIPGVAREFDAGTVTFVHLTPDSRWAVFTVDERGTIYSAPLSGGRRILPAPRNPDPFVRLAPADTFRDFQLDPASARAVFFRTVYGHAGPALHSVRVDGSGTAVEIVEPDEDGTNQVLEFAIDASARRVVFLRGDAAGELPRRLFSVPIDGSAPPTRLSPRLPRSYVGTPPGGAPGPLPEGGVLDFQLAPDGAWVLFRLQAGVGHLYAVPTDGSAPARRLASGVDLAAFTPDSTRAVYRAGSGASAELLVEALDGSADPLVLELAESVESLAVLEDAVLFVESPSGAGGARLLQVPLAGGRVARALSAPLPAGRTIREFHASPDEKHVVYSADADVAGVFTLFAVSSVPLVERARAFAGPRPEGRRIGGDADTVRFRFTPDSSAVLAHVVSAEGLSLERVALDGSVRRLSGREGASDVEVDEAGTVALYRGAREHDSRLHVYAAPLDEVAPAVQLDAFGPVLGFVNSYELHPNGREAIFSAGSRDFSFHEFHRVPLDLSRPPEILEGLLVGTEYLVDHRIEPLSGRLVYRLQVPVPSGYYTQLYSAPIDGSAPRLRLDQGDARVEDYRLAGARVLFRKDTNPPREHWELFSLPADGSSAAQILNSTMPVNDGRVYDFAVSPDASRIVYLASQNRSNRPEIFSVPTDGSQAAVQLNPVPVAGGEVWRGGFRITPDGTRVAFAGDLVLNGAFGLWSAPIGGGVPALALWSAPANREVEKLEVTPDSSRAVFTADGVVNARHQLYVAPLDGSAPAAALPTTSGSPKVYEFRLTPDGTRAVYYAGSIVASVLLDGSASPVVLSPPLAADRHVAGTLQVTDEWVLFRADQEQRGRYDLFVVPVDGSLPARRVDVTQGASGVEDFSIVGDEILFVAPSTPDYGGWALFRAPLVGGLPRALNQPGTFITTSSGPRAFQIHPDEHRILFSAYSTIGFVTNSRLYLGFLGQPVRGAGEPQVQAPTVAR